MEDYIKNEYAVFCDKITDEHLANLINNSLNHVTYNWDICNKNSNIHCYTNHYFIEWNDILLSKYKNWCQNNNLPFSCYDDVDNSIFDFIMFYNDLPERLSLNVVNEYIRRNQ